MSAPQVMTLQDAENAGLLGGTLAARALGVVARAEELRQQPGRFMDTLEAARLFGSMAATIECLVHELYVTSEYARGLRRLLLGEEAE